MKWPMNYDPKVGWFWHKSWNIPDIAINLEVRTSPRGVGEGWRLGQGAEAVDARIRPGLRGQGEQRQPRSLSAGSGVEGDSLPQPAKRLGPDLRPQVPDHLLLPQGTPFLILPL